MEGAHMPGWYIHMNIARNAIGALDSNTTAAALFGANCPSAAQLKNIGLANHAYVALGAIDPEIFFLLPDFKPPVPEAHEEPMRHSVPSPQNFHTG
jgi:hypothetical protein